MCPQTVLLAQLQGFPWAVVICLKPKLNKAWKVLSGSIFHLLRCLAASLDSGVSVWPIISGLCDQSFLMSKAFLATSVMGRKQALFSPWCGDYLYCPVHPGLQGAGTGPGWQCCCCVGKRPCRTWRSSNLSKDRQSKKMQALSWLTNACACHF